MTEKEIQSFTPESFSDNMVMTHPKCKDKSKNDEQEMLVKILAMRKVMHNCKRIMELQKTGGARSGAWVILLVVYMASKH